MTPAILLSRFFVKEVGDTGALSSNLSTEKIDPVTRVEHYKKR